MSDSLPKIRRTQPVTPEMAEFDHLYRQAFAQEPIKQSERFDELAKVLLTIELAALAAYFTLLPFLLEKQQNNLNWQVMIIMAVCWFFAFITTWIVFLPRKYPVLENIVRRKTDSPPDRNRLTIMEFYEVSTQHKKKYLFAAIMLFLVALIAMPFSFLRIF
jgi:hypothetical protein